jgi:hypothetical protein
MAPAAGSARTPGNARTQRPFTPPHRVSARRVPAVPPPARWAHTLRRAARYAIWALPGYAVLAGLSVLGDDAAFTTDRASYAHYLAHVRFTPAHLTYSVGTAFAGMVALVALAGLLAGTRCGRSAAVALGLGLAGVAVLLTGVGTVLLRQESARAALLRGRPSDVVLNPQLRGGGAVLAVLGGALLLTLAWMLLGVAVWRSRVLQRADGVLLIVSAPLLYLGGLVLRVVPVLGALLLLAAGLGVAWTATRLSPDDPPRADRSGAR